ncbi:MAG TPA: ABC transporter substrate-binding protein [Methylomirabilota bacterium]|jgi:NitT/TauT family transport system substrate-binding protein|nr:ABC transporter substrate-binding protein [Methylomirabilota bacterium]
MPRPCSRDYTRREFLRAAGALGAAGTVLGSAPRRVAAQPKRPIPITASHSVSTFVYAQHLVAREKKFFEDEGVTVDKGFIVPGGGAKVVQALAAGQAMFALGDSNHPLKISERGKEGVILFATDTRCSYANIVARKELYDAGLTGVEKLGTMKRPGGGKWIIAATAIGSGTHVYGTYVLEQYKGPDGKPLNSGVEWVGGGASTTMLGGLKAGKFDAIMAVPEWLWAAEDQGFGKAIYSVLDERVWTQVFGGPLPVTVGYCLRETLERAPDAVQGYVTACYRAQKWIQKSPEGEIFELLHKPYMDTFSRDEVLKSIRYYRGIFDWDFLVDEKEYNQVLKIFLATKVIEKEIPFAKAVDMSFVRKAHQKG